MSHEGDQVREWPGKDLQPHGGLSPSLMEEPCLPSMCVSAAACGYDRSRNPAPGRMCSTEKQTFFKKNLENLADDVTFLPNTYPRSLGLKEEGGEGWWVALFMLYWRANLSHTPGGDLRSCPHKGILALAPALTSPNWAQTSVWLECAGVLPGISGRTGWVLPSRAIDLVVRGGEDSRKGVITLKGSPVREL